MPVIIKEALPQSAFGLEAASFAARAAAELNYYCTIMHAAV
jgi:hypothetical protein